MANIIRKIVLLMISVFIPDENLFFKATAGILFLVFFLRI